MPLRLGILGMWHVHADGLIRQIASHPDAFELVGGYDPEPEVVTRRQTAWQALLPRFRWHSSAEAVLNEKLDGIVVEGRVHQNVKWAQLAVDAGLPVLMEKPAGDSFAPFHRLMETARAKSLHVQLIYLFRYMSAMRALIQRCRAGEFGQLYSFRGRLPKDVSLYREYVDELGCYRGGIFFEMAGHLVDLVVTLLGEPRRITPFLRHDHSSVGDFTDNGVAVLEMAHGLGIIEVPALEVATQQRRIEVYGSAGAAIIPHLGSGHVENQPIQHLQTFQQSSGKWTTHELPASTLQINDLLEFAAVVQYRKAPEYSAQHDLAVHRALLMSSGMWDEPRGA